MGTVRRRLGNERGSVVAIMAVTLMVMLALAALAIDLASLRDAKAESQRVADAIALAGASAFRDLPVADSLAGAEARDRAFLLARNEQVRNDTVDVRDSTWQRTTYSPGKFVYVARSTDLTMNIIPDSQIVRVWVRRAGIRTFFGKLLARPFGHVQSMATAWAHNAGPTVNCMKPFLIPDMWHEANKSTQDKNSNDYMEPDATPNGNGGGPNGGEQWFYEPSAGDYYAKYDPSVTSPPRPQTGYGSGRFGTPGDVGLPILLKPQTGNNQRQGNSYFTLDGPGQNLRDDIENQCINTSVGATPNFSQGSATGQAKQGISYLINEDPGATWNQTTRQVDGSSYADWTQSPRVIIVGLMDPIYIQGSSTNVKPDQGAVFNNFARIFLQDAPGNTDNIKGIFLGFAPGGTGGTVAGTLVKTLQLIQ
jgi:hypothetical protein